MLTYYLTLDQPEFECFSLISPLFLSDLEHERTAVSLIYVACSWHRQSYQQQTAASIARCRSSYCEIQKYLTEQDEIRQWVIALLAAWNVGKSLVVSCLVGSDVSFSFRRFVWCQLYTLSDVDTKQKIALLRIELSRFEAVINCQWWCCCIIDYISIVSKMIGWLSGKPDVSVWSDWFCLYKDEIMSTVLMGGPTHLLLLLASRHALFPLPCVLLCACTVYTYMQNYAPLCVLTCR